MGKNPSGEMWQAHRDLSKATFYLQQLSCPAFLAVDGPDHHGRHDGLAQFPSMQEARGSQPTAPPTATQPGGEQQCHVTATDQ